MRVLIFPLLSALTAFLPLVAGAADTVKSADGLRIAYESAGRGTTAIVFIHCWACDRHLWDAQMSEFAKDHRVVALDLGGHGESGRDRRSWTIQAFGGDVAAVVKKLKLKRVVLVGSSMGGAVALEAARRLGDRVAAVVPVDSLLDVEQRTPEDQIEAFVGQLRKDYAGSTSAMMKEYLFRPTSDPRTVARILDVATAAPADVMIDAIAHAWRYDAATGLAAVKVPVRAINTDMYPTNVQGNRKHAPQFGAVIMPGLSHYLMLDDPTGFNTQLDQILSRLGL